MIFAFPITVVMLPIAWFWLTRNLKSEVVVTLPDVGSWRSEEIRALSIFAITALLWVTREQPFGGWSELTGLTGATDAAVALLGALAMCVVASGKKSKSGVSERLLDWETALKIPWGILILFAGGICIAKAFDASGLSALLGNSFGELGSIPLFVLILLICLVVTFLTELTSNSFVDANPGSSGIVQRDRSADPDDPGHNQCELCVYASGGHSPECDRLWVE